jgi:hypothetical protein
VVNAETREEYLARINASASPPPPPPPKKSHKLRTTLIVLGALWVIGTLMGTNSSGSSGSNTSSGSGTQSTSGSGSRTSDTNKPTGKAEDCSIYKKDFNSCVETRTHDQLNRYYDAAESCDIESPRYLQCLNDAELSSH